MRRLAVSEDPSVSRSRRRAGLRLRFLSIPMLGFLKAVARIRTG